MYISYICFYFLFPDRGIPDRMGRPFHLSVHLGDLTTKLVLLPYQPVPSNISATNFSLCPTTPVLMNRGTFLLRNTPFWQSSILWHWEEFGRFHLLWRSGASSSTPKMVREGVSTSQYSNKATVKMEQGTFQSEKDKLVIAQRRPI